MLTNPHVKYTSISENIGYNAYLTLLFFFNFLVYLGFRFAAILKKHYSMEIVAYNHHSRIMRHKQRNTDLQWVKDFYVLET